MEAHLLGNLEAEMNRGELRRVSKIAFILYGSEREKPEPETLESTVLKIKSSVVF